MEYLDVAIKALIGILVGSFATCCGIAIKAMLIWVRALKAVVHDSFHRQCRALMDKPSITEDESENLEFLHDAYSGLKMNGTGKTLYEQVKKKPII